MPYILLGLLFTNLLPLWILQWMTGSDIYGLVKGMHNYSETENQSRVTRIIKYIKQEQTGISLLYLAQMLCEVIGFSLTMFQILYCDAIFHNGCWNMMQQSFDCKTFFPQETRCTLSIIGLNEKEEIYEYLCILSMQTAYCKGFILMAILYGFHLSLSLLTMVRQILFFIPQIRR